MSAHQENTVVLFSRDSMFPETKSFSGGQQLFPCCHRGYIDYSELGPAICHNVTRSQPQPPTLTQLQIYRSLPDSKNHRHILTHNCTVVATFLASALTP